MSIIVEFNSDWYLRGTVVTGDKSRASQFPDEATARKALQAASKYLKRSAVKSVKFTTVEEK